MGTPEVVLECFKAFANVGFRSKSNKNAMAKDGVAEAILECIEQHKTDVRVVNEARTMLRRPFRADSRRA